MHRMENYSALKKKWNSNEGYNIDKLWDTRLYETSMRFLEYRNSIKA